ncbi:MAG: hypothetical protein WCP97_09250 [bacterium]
MHSDQKMMQYLHSAGMKSIKLDNDIVDDANPVLNDITVLPGTISARYDRREFLKEFGKKAALLGLSSIAFSALTTSKAVAGGCPSHTTDVCQCESVSGCSCNKVGICECNKVCTCNTVLRH